MNSQHVLLAALTRPGFYLELGLIATVLGAAWLISVVIRRQFVRALSMRPLRRLDADMMQKPLALLFPLLALLMLGVAKPFAAQYAEGGEWTHAAMQLALAAMGVALAMLMVQSRAMAWFIGVVVMALALLDVTGFMASTTAALDALSMDIGKVRLSALGIIKGALMLVVVLRIANLLSQTLSNYLQRRSSLNHSTRELIVKFFSIIVYTIAFLMTLGVMGIDLTALAIFGGALGVGVGLGLQKITANFVSGVTLLLEKSIKLGDLVEVGGVMGHVRALNIRYARIETADGRELLIPNEMLISTQVTNWTYSNTQGRVEFRLPLPYDADLAQAAALVMECIRAHPKALTHPAPYCVLSEFGDYALFFRVGFWVADMNEGRLHPQDEVMQAIVRTLAQHNIFIPLREKI